MFALVLIFIGLFLILVLLVLVSAPTAHRRDNDKAQELDQQLVIKAGKYIHGHPDINVQLADVVLSLKDKDLGICVCDNFGDLDQVAAIPLDKIEDVTLEDASTVERRVTLARMALVGPFAFALKKKEKHELSYLVVTWKSGRFKHETYFEFEGKNAMGRGNLARNEVIKLMA